MDGGIKLGSRLLSQSVRGLSLLSGGGGGGIRLSGAGSGFSCFLAGIGGLLISRSYLAVQITNRLVSFGFVVIGILLQSAKLSLRLVGLLLDRRDRFPDVLLRCTSYT